MVNWSTRSTGRLGVEPDVGNKGWWAGQVEPWGYVTHTVESGARTASNRQGHEPVKDTALRRQPRGSTRAGGGAPGRMPVPAGRVRGAREAWFRGTQKPSRVCTWK